MLGLGCMGRSKFYGTNDGESISAIYRALDLGVTLSAQELAQLEVIAPPDAAAGERCPANLMASLNQ